MCFDRKIHSLITLGILAVIALSTDAGERPHSTKKRITAAECERLVTQLINPNKPPFKGDYYTFPEKLDLRKIAKQQEKICGAYDSLSDNIEASLPILVEHVGDDRFSYVYEDVGTSGVITKASVGEACRQIIEAHVEVYRQEVTRTDFASIPRCPSFIGACGGVKKWWKSWKEKTLAELQVEGIEWARQLNKPRLFESEEEWTKAKKSLGKMAADIRASNKPIKVEDHLFPLGK
jgi:hypothetical protein